MLFTCVVAEPMHGESKKYMILEFDKTNTHTIKTTNMKNSLQVLKLVDPLKGNTLKVKIPFRYNRVMCAVTGGKTIQEMVKGDRVQVDIKYCGWWQSGDVGGPTWKFASVAYCPV